MTTGTTTKVHGFRVEHTAGPDVLRFTDIELPPPGPGQALVRLHAAGVNFLDVGQRKGLYPAKLPFTLGVEGAGVVEQVGDGVATVKIGDRVAYTGGPGSYAQANIVRADQLIPLPPDMDFVQGAAFRCRA